MSTPAIPAAEVRSSAPIAVLIGKIVRSFAFKSFLQALLTIWLTLTVTFVLVRLLPSNPLETYVRRLMDTQGLTFEDASARAASIFGAAQLDRPVAEQYISYLGSVLRLDLGSSLLSTGTSVLEIIGTVLPWTLFCVGLSLLISFAIGVGLGMLMALWRNSLFDLVLTTLFSYLSSIPNYMIAILLLYIGGVGLNLFSPGQMRGAYDPNVEVGSNVQFLTSIFEHAFLPVLTYVLATVGHWALSMKSSTMGVLGEEYVNVATARGLGRARIMTAYVGRNASLPLFTQLALSIGFIISGSLLIESYWQYPGVGVRLLDAVLSRDYTVMQGIFLFITISVILSNLLADILYSRLDPRVRIGK